MTPQDLWLIFLGLALLAGILSGVPVLLAMSGVPVLVAVFAALFGQFDLSFFGAFPQRVFGIMNNPLLIAVPLFVLMGVLLEKSRIAEKMLLIMAALLGGSRSGLAYSVLIVSALIAASTGIIGATIVMLGMISLPAMLRAGLSPRLSSGLICASGTLGQIIPPSIVLILLGDQISNAYIQAQQKIGNFAPDPVSVGDLFAGAILPGLLLVGLYAIYIFVHGFLSSKHGAEVVADAAPNDQLIDITKVGRAEILGTFLPPLLLIGAVLGSILMGVATPTEAAVVGVAGTLLIAAGTNERASRSLKLATLVGAISAFGLVVLTSTGLSAIDFSSGSLAINGGSIVAIGASLVLVAALGVSSLHLLQVKILTATIFQTINVSAMVFGIIIAASMLSLVFRGFGGDEVIEALLNGIPGDKWVKLFVVMLVMFFLGFMLDFVEIIFIVIPIVGPVLLAADFHPVWFAILIAMNLQTSFLTPPFGFALFYFRSVAPESISTKDIYVSIIPFVIIQIIAIGLLMLFPALATWLPSIVFS